MLTLARKIAATTATLGLVTTMALTATSAVADPLRPGCTVDDLWADHTTGVVAWSVTCAEPRDVVVDVSAWSGTPDDHDLVDSRTEHRRVSAGDTWSSVVAIDPALLPHVDQVTAQALSWVDQGDTTERPAILGSVAG
jgi:hypothetical protein